MEISKISIMISTKLREFIKFKSKAYENITIQDEIRFICWLLCSIYLTLMQFFDTTSSTANFIFIAIVIIIEYYVLSKRNSEHILAIISFILFYYTNRLLYLDSAKFFDMLPLSFALINLYCLQHFKLYYNIIFSSFIFYDLNFLRAVSVDILKEYYFKEDIVSQMLGNSYLGWVISLSIIIVSNQLIQNRKLKETTNYRHFKTSAEGRISKLEEIKKKNEIDLHALKAQNKELETKNSEYQKTIEILNRYSNHSSKEISNPLNHILSNLIIIEKNLKEPPIKKLFMEMKSTVENLLSINKNFEEISNISSLKKVNPTEIINIGIFLDNMIRNLKHIIDIKSIETHIIINKTLPKFIQIDEDLLSKILTNLTKFSIRSTKSGSIRLVFDWIINEDENWYHETLIPEFCEKTNNGSNFSSFNERIGEISIPATPQSKNGFETFRDKNFLAFSFENFDVQKLCMALDEKNESGFLKIDIIDSGDGLSEEFNKYLLESDIPEPKLNISNNDVTALELKLVKVCLDKIGGSIKITIF